MKKVILNQILVFSLLTNTLLQKSLASDLAPSDKSMISTEDASLEHNNTIKMSVADLVAKDISESMLRLLIIAYTFDKTSNQREFMIRTGYDYKYNEMLFNSAFGSMVAEVIVATLVSSYGMGLFAAKANDTISSNAFFGGSLAIPMTTSLSAMLISEYVLNPLEKRREDEVPQQREILESCGWLKKRI